MLAVATQVGPVPPSLKDYMQMICWLVEMWFLEVKLERYHVHKDDAQKAVRFKTLL